MFELESNRSSVRSVAAVADAIESTTVSSRSVPTGFGVLDQALEGGLRTGDLTVVGGTPGVGKTTLVLQMARNIAMAGKRVVFACYDHDETSLLTRLLMLELGDLTEGSIESASRTRARVRAVARGETTLGEELSGNLLLRAAHGRLQAYGDRLWLQSASRTTTGLEELSTAARQVGSGGTLFVDYMQKVPSVDSASEDVRIDHVAAALKEIALEHNVAVVAVVVGDQIGLSVRRIRIQHMRGASGVAYESDVILMLNEKYLAVSKRHSAFDAVAAESFKRRIVVSVDKNRHGPGGIDLEFRKEFLHFRFDPDGGYVDEQLIDDLMFPE
jgi:replicative DNA helicase